MFIKYKAIFVSISIIFISLAVGYLRNWGLNIQGGDLGFFEATASNSIDRYLYLWSYTDGFGGLGTGKSGLLLPLSILELFGKLNLPPFLIQYLYVTIYFIAGFLGIFKLIEYISPKEKNYILLCFISLFYVFNFFSFSFLSVPLYIFLTFYFLTPFLTYNILKYFKDGNNKNLLGVIVILIFNQATFINITLIFIQLLTIFIFFIFHICYIKSKKGASFRLFLIILLGIFLNIGMIFETVLFINNSVTLLVNSGINKEITSTSAKVSQSIYSMKNMLSFTPGNIHGLWWDSNGLIEQFKFSKLYQSLFFVITSFLPVVLLVFGLIKEGKAIKGFNFLLASLLTIFGIYGFSGYILTYAEMLPVLGAFRNVNKFLLPLMLIFCCVLYLLIYRNKIFRLGFYFYLVVYLNFAISGYFLSYYNYGSLNKVYAPENLSIVLNDIVAKYGKGNCVVYPADDFILWGYNWGYVGYSPLILNQNLIPCFHKNGDILSKGNAIAYEKIKNIQDLISENYKRFNIKYIFLHKDINYKVFNRENIENKLQLKFNENNFAKVYENEYFTIFISDKAIKGEDINGENLISQKKNPTNYVVGINSLFKKQSITFLQSFHSEWRLYLEPYSTIDCGVNVIVYSGAVLDESGTNELHHVTECLSNNQFYAGGEISKLWQKPIFDETHTTVYDYANQWTIDPEYIKKNYPKEYYYENSDGSIDVRMTLYFRPQSYFYLGLIISGVTLLSLIGYLGYDIYRRRKTHYNTD